MKTLLIGSRALKYWEPDFNLKDNADWDIISEAPLQAHDDNYEWHPTATLNNAEILAVCGSGHYVKYCGELIEVAPIVVLAMIKRSHLWRDLAFDKHITMYTKHLKKHVPIERGKDFYDKMLKERTALTMQQFPQHKISLKKTVNEFFDDYVTKKYLHDYLHELYAHYDRPLYERMQNSEVDSVFCHKDKWLEFSHEDKIKCIQEEAYVIATERFLVPRDWNYSFRLAYYKAVCKICTTLTSGFFRDYAIDNFEEVMDNLSIDKFNNVKEILNV